MTVRPIRQFGDPVLREISEPVTRFGDALARLVADLIETCRLPGRAGLAAPQIGIGLRVFSYNVDGTEGYVINPRLVSSGGYQDGPEGCLSIPGLYLPTPRAARAIVAGVDLRGRDIEVEGTGELARCLQHELDHLDGHVYPDRLDPAERRHAMTLLTQHLAAPVRGFARRDTERPSAAPARSGPRPAPGSRRSGGRPPGSAGI